MVHQGNDGAKIWNAPVLEELTIDLTAIANGGKSATTDNGGKGKAVS